MGPKELMQFLRLKVSAATDLIQSFRSINYLLFDKLKEPSFNTQVGVITLLQSLDHWNLHMF